jgi:FG-GAP-like repeat
MSTSTVRTVCGSSARTGLCGGRSAMTVPTANAGFFTPALNFGRSGFIPVPGDYDGDGKTDAAVYQSSTGNWFIQGSSAGFFTPALNFGGSGFVPVAGDYDGDGETDAAVYQSSTGNWFVKGSSAGFFAPALNFGGSGFLPVLPPVTILRALRLL